MKLIRRALSAVSTRRRRGGSAAGPRLGWHSAAARRLAATRTAGPIVTRRVALVGHGVVGSRVERSVPVLLPDVDVVHVDTRLPERASTHAGRRRRRGRGLHRSACGDPRDCSSNGRFRRSPIGDELDDVAAMLELDQLALDADIPLVVGAGMAPGLSGLLVRHLSDQLAASDEIHVAVHGTAGPACARQHHRALAGNGLGTRRRRVGPTACGYGSRAVLVPRTGRRVRLLPRRTAHRRCCCVTCSPTSIASAPRCRPTGATGSRPRLPMLSPSAPRGRRRRPAGRGTRRRRRRRPPAP